MGPHCKVGRYWNINSIINTIQAQNQPPYCCLLGHPCFLMISAHATLDTQSCQASLLSPLYLTVRSCPHLRSVNCTRLMETEFALENHTWHSSAIFICHVICKTLTWVMSVSVWIVLCCQLHDTDGSSNIPPEVAGDPYRRSVHASLYKLSNCLITKI